MHCVYANIKALSIYLLLYELLTPLSRVTHFILHLTLDGSPRLCDDPSHRIKAGQGGSHLYVLQS